MSSSATYGLGNVQWVCAVPNKAASGSKEQFWIASNSASAAHPKPELHRIEVSTATTTSAAASTAVSASGGSGKSGGVHVTCKQMLALPHSVVHVAAHPSDAKLVLLVSYKSSYLFHVADESSDAQLETRTEVAHGDGVITRQFVWHANHADTQQQSVAQLCATHVLVRDVARLSDAPVYTRLLRDRGITSEAAWNPHKVSELAYTSDKSVVGVDTRQSGDAAAAWTVANADSVQALTLDFNPTAANYVACGGIDGTVRVFDLRRTAEPALRLKNHEHWVAALRYSHFNDNLLLTGGTDNSIKVYSLWSVSAAQQAAMQRAPDAAAEAASRSRDKLLLDITTEHEDAVRTVAWAANNPKLLISGSYTGRVVVTLMN
jgi:hypothetical protein